LERKLKKRKKITEKKRSRKSGTKSNGAVSTIKGDLDHTYPLSRVGLGDRRYRGYQQGLF